MLTTVHDVRELRLRENHPRTLDARQELVHLELHCRDCSQAASDLRSVVETRLRVSGDTHVATLLAMNFLSEAESELGHFDAADDVDRKAIEVHRSGADPVERARLRAGASHIQKSDRST